jgi:UDP-glucose:(heptosyl)LPS alpha-1,3-glucosyltransferase
MMSIALCHPFVQPSRGGCETYIVDLARRLVRDGHEVALLAWDWDPGALPAGVKVRRLPRPWRCPRPRRPWAFSAACRDERARHPHDVSIGFDKVLGVDIHYPQGGSYLATAAHNRLVPRSPFARFGIALRQLLDPGFWSFRRLELRQLRNERCPIVVNSRFVRDHILRVAPAAAGRVVVIPNAIDPGRFDWHGRRETRDRVRSEWGIHNSDTVGLFAAMNYALKGLAPLLEAFRLIPPDLGMHIVVVGHPNCRRYERMARLFGLFGRVHFMGRQTDMRACYLGADFLVHPTFYDPCSLVALEALACELPVITSRHNGAAELLDPTADEFVIDDPYQSHQLAQAMMRLLDPVARTSAARASRRAAGRWTFEDHYQALTGLMSLLARQKHHSQAADDPVELSSDMTTRNTVATSMPRMYSPAGSER